jgi:hypothetical protein
MLTSEELIVYSIEIFYSVFDHTKPPAWAPVPGSTYLHFVKLCQRSPKKLVFCWM